MRDDISPKEMDRLVDLAQEDTDYAMQNARNNEPNYVASRLLALHSGHRIKFGEQHLMLIVKKNLSKSFESGPNNQGVIAEFEDFHTMTKDKYLVETNGHNGVQVTRKI